MIYLSTDKYKLLLRVKEYVDKNELNQVSKMLESVLVGLPEPPKVCILCKPIKRE